MRSREEVLTEYNIERDEEDGCLILPQHRDTIINALADRIRELESPPRPEPVACERCARLDEGMAALAATLDQHDAITLSDYIVQRGEEEWDQRIVMSHGDDVYHDVGSVEELLFREALSRRNAKAIGEVLRSDLTDEEKQERVKRILETETQPFTRHPSVSLCDDCDHAPCVCDDGEARTVNKSATEGAEPFDARGARRLAEAAADLVRRGVVSSRSPLGDALLDFAPDLCTMDAPVGAESHQSVPSDYSEPVVPVVTEADENGDVWMSVSVGPVTVDEAIACLRRHGWAIDTAALTAAPAVPVVTEDARYAALYGRCPKCSGLGMARERRPDGNDKCVNGHVYPSRDAITPASEVRG